MRGEEKKLKLEKLMKPRKNPSPCVFSLSCQFVMNSFQTDVIESGSSSGGVREKPKFTFVPWRRENFQRDVVKAFHRCSKERENVFRKEFSRDLHRAVYVYMLLLQLMFSF
jgi:hypothetical protein